MNTITQRLENRTNRILKELDMLGQLSKHGDAISQEQAIRVREAIQKKLNEACGALEAGRDAVNFTLDENK